ncbi:MAG: tetratricopeptide repeat protein [Polyangiaceae bacterium]|jgi:tetratricopeptide (TPR) repeat protein
MRLRLAVLIVPILLAAGPVTAADSALQEARKLTSAAMVEYNVGRFERALDLYTKAYERYPKPALLFDLGQCHRQLGHFERALFFFHGYLREQPNASNRPLAEKLLEDSQRQLDAQKAAEAEAEAKAAEAQRAQNASAASAPATTGESLPAPASTAVPGPPPPPPSPLFRVVGLATAGVGVVLVGVGAYAGLRSASLAKQISQVSAQQGTWTPQYQSDYESGKSLATVANVLFVSGAVALGTGAALAWFGWPKAAPAMASVAPLPGGASVDLLARF